MLDVALTVAHAHPAEVAVVIDVLRATTTITHALDCGYRRVLVVDSLEGAEAMRAPPRAIAGERDCVRPPGFDLGNSPEDADPPIAEELVLATTNGAPAIIAAAAVTDEVLLGCLLNLDAVCAAISGRDALLVCAGVEGNVGLDDVYVAGRIAAALPGERTDAALLTQAVATAHGSPRDAIGAGAAARLLVEVGLEADIDFCAQESITATVPRVTAIRGGIATLRAHSRPEEQETFARGPLAPGKNG
ncbi:MAG: 2-phosphosulfolactate phosphatase [Actinomycetota bacterium]|nr:2-phosphosulfolactate phosphatase [Actinomycetota bacterium]